MDDRDIIKLYLDRDEEAIAETRRKYSRYCHYIALRITGSEQDAEETVNDACLKAWNTIPPRRPTVLAAFLGKITRHIAIDRWRERSASKRGGGEITLALEELENCVAGTQNVETELERKEIIRAYVKFLDTLPITERRVFLCRYYYVESIETIANKFGFSQSKVKTMLHRTRTKLRRQLAKEGY